MRGNPVKEWIVFSVLWLLLLIPIIKLTISKNQPLPPAPQVQDAVAARTVQGTAVIRYTGAPTGFRVLQQGKLLCESVAPPSGGTECRLTLQLTENSAELILQAEWPDDQEHVFEIELVIDNLEEQRALRWVQQKLDDVVSFEWRGEE